MFLSSIQTPAIWLTPLVSFTNTFVQFLPNLYRDYGWSVCLSLVFYSDFAFNFSKSVQNSPYFKLTLHFTLITHFLCFNIAQPLSFFLICISTYNLNNYCSTFFFLYIYVFSILFHSLISHSTISQWLFTTKIII